MLVVCTQGAIIKKIGMWVNESLASSPCHVLRRQNNAVRLGPFIVLVILSIGVSDRYVTFLGVLR